MTYMIIDGHSLEGKFDITDIRGRGILVNNIESIQVAGKAGEYFVSRNIPARILEIDIVIARDKQQNIRESIREINADLSLDEPKPIIFSDDEGITYHGIPAESQENGEIVSTARATISILCVDPFAYSGEKTHRFESDITTMVNEGSEEAEPIFNFNVLQPITFAMVQNQDDEYQLIGTPSDDEVEPVDYRTSVLYENGSTLDEWERTENRDMVNNDVNISDLDGTMTTDDAGIRVDGYGTVGNGQRGAAIFRDLGRGIQDFEMETTFDIISRRELENFRMMIYFNDENMNPIGHIGLKDNSRNYKRRVPITQLGQHNQGVSILGDASERIDSSPDTSLFYLRFRREGNRFSVYIGFWRNQRHETTWEEIYNDNLAEYQGQLRYITLFIGSYQDRGTPNRIRMNSVELFELRTIVEDQTPYIARAGDEITFDHRNGDLLINGENRKDIKDFGGQYFTLKKGLNQLIVHPSDSLEANVQYRETHR